MKYGRSKPELIPFEGNIYHLAPVPIVYKIFEENKELNKEIIASAKKNFQEKILEVPDERHVDELGTKRDFTAPTWKETQIPAVGIWHSVATNNILNIQEDPIIQLTDIIKHEFATVIKKTTDLTSVNSYISESWIQFYKNGDKKVLHNHERYGPPYPENRWAGAYYLDDGEPDENMPYSGVFSFRIRQSNHYFKPVQGMLLMFPADILHEVHPFYGQRERIVINFNINTLTEN